MLEERPAWQARALCNTGDASLVDVFFGRGRHDFDGERAKQICAACPVTAECLEYALANVLSTGSEFTPVRGHGGVWGGYTHSELFELRRQLEGAA